MGSSVHLLYGCDEMTYKLGKDGWPTDEVVISTRDKEIESLRQRVHTFESLETKRMKDAVTVEDWRRIAEHMEYNWRCWSDGFNKTASNLRQQLAECLAALEKISEIDPSNSWSCQSGMAKEALAMTKELE